jgi:drug/metabolite transporter (DMT)-like permease
MGLAVIALISVSAFMHAGWNAASSSRRPTASFFLVANTAGAIVLLPLLIVYAGHLPDIPWAVWSLLALTGASMALYYTALAGAYRSGEMSVAYPVARSLPVLMVAGVEGLLGLGEPVGGFALGGMALVVTGCLVVPRGGPREAGRRSYLNATFALALVTAVGVTGYSIIDHEALAALRIATPELGRVGSVLVYAPLEALSASVFLGIYCVINPTERAALGKIVRSEKLAAASTGVAIYATYMLVLVAMNFAANASYVVAFRQLSIPLGVALGVVALKEPAPWTKLAGVGAIFAGLVLLALSL